MATAATGYDGPPQLAARWQGIVAFRLARALTQLIDDSVSERPGDTVLPDWAEGPPDSMSLAVDPTAFTWDGQDSDLDSGDDVS